MCTAIYLIHLTLPSTNPNMNWCDTCVVFNNCSVASEIEKTAQDENIRMKTMARDYGNDIKKELALVRLKHCCRMVWLALGLNCPKGKAPEFNYKRKLGIYNLSVYGLPTAETNCYMWPKYISGRWANEIFFYLSWNSSRKNQNKERPFFTIS